MSIYIIPECPICFEPLLTKIVTTTCGHVFHNLCLRHCIYENGYCPLCRNKDKTVINISFEIKTKTEEEGKRLESSSLCELKEKERLEEELEETKRKIGKLKKDYFEKMKEGVKQKEEMEKLSIMNRELRERLIESEYSKGEYEKEKESLIEEFRGFKDDYLSMKMKNEEYSKKISIAESFFEYKRLFDDDFKDRLIEFQNEVKEILRSGDALSRFTSKLYVLYNTIDELNMRIKMIKKNKTKVNYDEEVKEDKANNRVVSNLVDLENFFYKKSKETRKNEEKGNDESEIGSSKKKMIMNFLMKEK